MGPVVSADLNKNEDSLVGHKEYLCQEDQGSPVAEGLQMWTMQR